MSGENGETRTTTNPRARFGLRTVRDKNGILKGIAPSNQERSSDDHRNL